MSTYEIIKKLCSEHGIALTALEKELGFGRGSLGKLKMVEPRQKGCNKSRITLVFPLII